MGSEVLKTGVNISYRQETPENSFALGSLDKTKTIPDLPPSATVNTHDEISLQFGSTSSRPLLNSRYVLLEEIGRGGMAIVYLSWDLILRHSVAIKILRPDGADPDSLRREAAAALELTHEAILCIYHFEPGDEGKIAYMVMEYLPWPSGEKWIADAGAIGLPVRSVVQVGARIRNALAYAHSRNVLHLDIKPSNIFVDPGGENAKLGDFGLARLTSIGGTVIQFRPAGTPAYMAPEQKAYGPKVSPATDVYQLGATLWDFCTGNPPKVDELDIRGLEPAQRRLLTILQEVLVPDPFKRPTAIQFGEMITLAS